MSTLQLSLLFLLMFIALTSYCLIFAFFNYIYILIFLDLLLLGLILLFLDFSVLLQNLELQNFSLIILGVGACETAVGLLLFVGTFKLQIVKLFE